jgi:hypothetical protein
MKIVLPVKRHRGIRYARTLTNPSAQKCKNTRILRPGIEPGSQQCECRVLTAILSEQRCNFSAKFVFKRSNFKM